MTRYFVFAFVAMGMAVFLADGRRMTAKEIVDGLIEKSPYRDQLEVEEWLRHELRDTWPNARRDTQRLPIGTRAKLVILSDDTEEEKTRKKQKAANEFTGCASCGGTNLDTKEEMPFLHRLLEVMTSVKLSTQDGTRNVLRTAFPVLFRADKDQNN